MIDDERVHKRLKQLYAIIIYVMWIIDFCWNLIGHHKFLAEARDYILFTPDPFSLQGKAVWSGDETVNKSELVPTHCHAVQCHIRGHIH